MPAEEAVATLRDAWASLAFAATLDAFRGYRFDSPEQLRGTPVMIAWGCEKLRNQDAPTTRTPFGPERSY
jgi:hypothetical protein